MSGKSHPIKASGSLSNYGRAFKVGAIVPLVIVLAVFSVYPLIQLFFMSFAKITISGSARLWEWVGLENYVRMFADAGFWTAVGNTLIYVFVSMGVEIFLGLSLALLTTKIKRGAGLYRTILMLPLLVPPIAIATSWRLIYNANFGLINKLSISLGWGQQYWLSEPRAALPAVIAVSVWYWTAYSFILLLAGLQNIPHEIYESASIDGANGRQKFLRMTLPLLKPALAVTIMFRAVNAFKVFDIVYALTGGGPGLATEVINTYVYNIFISQQRLGYGASLATTAIVLVGAIALTYSKASGVQRGVRV